MTARNASSAFTLLSAVAALVFASAADAEVYKCQEANGTVAYQDYPCKGGTVVDIRAGAADPAAVDRLQRGNAAFDRAAAGRNANEAIAAQRREALYQQGQAAEAAQSMAEAAANASAIYVPAYRIAAPIRKHRPHVHRRADQQRAAAASGGGTVINRRLLPP